MSDEEYRQDFVEARRIRYFEERVKELEAEIERLRGALGQGILELSAWGLYGQTIDKMRAALAGKD